MRGRVNASNDHPDFIERTSLCYSLAEPGMVKHSHQDGFTEGLRRLYAPAESNALEQLVQFKTNLRKATTDEFWPLLTEGLTDITSAQYGFVSKRILVDDMHSAVEMPPIGEPGACLMGAAFYINDGHGFKTHLKDFKYHAYSCPCAYMKHDKVFIIPERLNEFIVDNPNDLKVAGEAYMGIPLFADGKCFAHFGVMWSPEGAANRTLGWGYLEMLFHSLEDIILDRVLQRDGFARPPPSPPSETAEIPTPRVLPHEAISIAQSLKPYARSLSHELRTPMQGVVGMLDVMHATVTDRPLDDTKQIRQMLEELKENIEAVQDSSRRAVVAADNVVHAYDMNMGIPETPLSALDNDPASRVLDAMNHAAGMQESLLTTKGYLLPSPLRNMKRRRESTAWSAGSVPKFQATTSTTSRTSPDRKIDSKGLSFDPSADASTAQVVPAPSFDREEFPKSPVFASEDTVIPGLRYTDLREVIQYVITDSLKVGGRPESVTSQELKGGAIIEVKTKSPSGQENVKNIEWLVDGDVPDTILIDEKDLAKTISCIVLNAVKFTDVGTITLRAKLSQNSRYIVITVQDTGPGIPSAFLPYLFKPFSREDVSLSRQTEGLGLGLMVAKGLARKLGGDLYCLRSDVSGPAKGSEFEMRVPLRPGEICSRPGTPSGSPTTRSRRSVDLGVAERNSIRPPTPPIIPEKMNTPSTPKIVGPLHHLHIPSPPLQMESPRSRNMNGHPAAFKGITRSTTSFDRKLCDKYPLNFLVVEDNRINRNLLVAMLKKLGYKDISQAYDGHDAVNQMKIERQHGKEIDVILMDLWMPLMDGYQAAEEIFRMGKHPIILAVTADATHSALDRAAKVGMKGSLSKPFMILDLEKLITKYCAHRRVYPHMDTGSNLPAEKPLPAISSVFAQQSTV
ncbi:uncharacterized protein BDZ99DRAFT_309890 [Mytilinidion resinicola]|uniref:histidine kinase n=1 Tax=Mytilinidion resinicola TaxID=574789 RepID=A0A6A6YP69_9PEZI|nr:uncharacterized protein BDZ99DRAFT_309890 [Mytilinidion resinicola]KAF2810349.1 hypothetical protein BDZ99DRAFT_309890 [Mytilinidion resinicola]